MADDHSTSAVPLLAAASAMNRLYNSVELRSEYSTLMPG
jgi:hypothetical protein